MAIYNSTEGVIRQNTGRKLKLLDFKEPVDGSEIIMIDNMVHVKTSTGNIPIYMFKMDKNLQELLHEYYHIWNG